jgi:hypothetical protein
VVVGLLSTGKVGLGLAGVDLRVAIPTVSSTAGVLHPPDATAMMARTMKARPGIGFLFILSSTRFC